MYAGAEDMVNNLGTELRNAAGNQDAELKAMDEFTKRFQDEINKERIRLANVEAPEEAKEHYDSLGNLDKKYQGFVDTLSKGISDVDNAKIAEAFTDKYPSQDDVTKVGQLWQGMAVTVLQSKPATQNDYLASATKVQIDFNKELNKFFADFAKAGAIVPPEKPEIQKAYADAIKILERYYAAWTGITPTAESRALHTSYGGTITRQVELFKKMSQANDVGNQEELAKLEQERFNAATESLTVTKQWNESVSAALAIIAEG